jgi:hypothetical protein
MHWHWLRFQYLSYYCSHENFRPGSFEFWLCILRIYADWCHTDLAVAAAVLSLPVGIGYYKENKRMAITSTTYGEIL